MTKSDSLKRSSRMGGWFGLERIAVEATEDIVPAVAEDVSPDVLPLSQLSPLSPGSASSGTMSIYHGSQCSTLVPPSPESAVALDRDYGRVWRGR